ALGNPNLGTWAYMSTATLANPAWTPATPVINSASFDTHMPADRTLTATTPGVFSPNYPSVVDPDSPGRNFEYSHANFYMYYATNFMHISDNRDRNLYRVGITVTPQ